jgi:acyl-CoA thioesterase II
MPDLAADTELTSIADGVFERELSRNWEIWGPNGGYLATLALRAAGAASGRARPANISVHFLGVAGFDQPVVLRATVLRSARVATSLQVTMSQGDRLILQAMVWAVDDGLDGLAHDVAVRPSVPLWHELPTIHQRCEEAGSLYAPSYPFWLNFEQRPCSWIADWENRPAGLEPAWLNWLRFDSPLIDDPWITAGRLLLLVDLGGWPAAGVAHVANPFVAPSIDVSCEFHRLEPVDWLLLDALSDHAGGGLVASRQCVWDERGRLLANGISHLLCRRVG